jgi:hypothetical protein
MSALKVGSKVKVDKDSPKWKTLTGQWLVITKFYPNAEQSKVAVDFEVLRTEADATAVSIYLSTLARGGTPTAAQKRLYDSIIASHRAMDPLVSVARGSWHHITSQWRDLLAESATEDEVSPLVGRVITFIAVSHDNIPTLLENAVVDRLDGDGSVVVKAPPDHPIFPGKEFTVSRAAVDAAPAEQSDSSVEVFKGAGLPADFLNAPVFDRKGGKVPEADLLRSQFLDLCRSAGISTARDADDDDDAGFDSYLRRSVKQLVAQASANGLSLDGTGAVVPDFSSPSALGKCLAKAKTKALDVSSGPTVSPPPKSLASALERTAVTASEWNKFLHAAVTITVEQPDKREGVRSSVPRSTAALERSLVAFGCTIATLSSHPSKSKSSDDLLCLLDSLEASASAPNAKPDTVVVGAAADRLRAPPGSRSSIGNEHGTDAQVRLSVKSTAAEVIDNPALFAKLQTYFAALDLDDEAATLQAQLEAETDPHVVRLLSAPVDDLEKLLHGVLADHVSSSIIRVRNTLDKRVERLVMPSEDQDPTEREASQIRKIRRGEFKKVKLLELIDRADSGTSASPLAGFAKLPAEIAGEEFGRALDRMRTVIQVTRPNQALKALRFFTALVEHIRRARLRGATWEHCSSWYAAIAKKVESSAIKFATGSSDVSLHALDFNEAWISDHTARYNRDLDEAIVDSMRSKPLPSGKRPLNLEGGGKGAGGKKPKGKNKGKQKGKNKGASSSANNGDEDATEADDEEEDNTKTLTLSSPNKKWGTFIPSTFGAATQKKFSDAHEKYGTHADGRFPCGFHCSQQGSCTHQKRTGKVCPFYHPA